ncbi:hypothetical protein B0H10DRAFT_1952954 [Mycena sp. CBHHK59/15]|nr:hypothetical protein B0H10DRAFT_1952954 [Mycena sp. CBHHK59/15]
MQSLSLDLSGRDDAESLVNVVIQVRTSKAHTRHHALKEMASNFNTNLRNLEEPWRTLFAELFRAVLPRHVMIQEEGTLWTFHDTPRNPGVVSPPFNRTMPLARKTGYEHRTDFRAILFLIGGLIHFPILGENKAAISRQDAAVSGWPANFKGRVAFVQALRRAVSQVELQAVVLFKTDSDASLPATRQPSVFLIAAVGPIYAVSFAARDKIEEGYANVDVGRAARRLDALMAEEQRDAHRKQPDAAQPQTPGAPDTMMVELDSFDPGEYTRTHSKLPDGSWSKPMMLDTPESDAFLLSLQHWPYLM